LKSLFCGFVNLDERIVTVQEGCEFSNECLIVLLIEDSMNIRCLGVVVEIQLCKLFWLDTFPLQWPCEMIQSMEVH